MPKYSIVIPAYNAEKYIKKCLDSILNQEYKDCEIIVVNDGSTDSTKEILSKYKKIKVINVENGGQAKARNIGYTNAHGKFILFIDSDDYVSNSLFKDLDDYIDDADDIIIFDYNIISPEGTQIAQYKMKCQDHKKVSNKEYILSEPCIWNKVYKKEFLDKINFHMPEGIIYEDLAYVPSLAKYNPRIVHMKKTLYYYIHSDSSTMRSTQYKKKYEDIIKASNILIDNLKDTKYQDELVYLLYYHILYLGSLLFYNYKKYDMIDKIADLMNKNAPKWKKNPYVKKAPYKQTYIANLFYKKKYKKLLLLQKIKKVFKHEKKSNN